MPLMDQIAEVGPGFQRKAVFPGGFQHVLDSLASILVLGGLVAARAQWPLNWLFATGIEVDVHTER